MQNKSTVGSTFKGKKKKGTLAVVFIGSFSPLKHYLNENEKPVWERIIAICVPYVCQGPGIPAGAFSCLQPAAHCTLILQLLPFSDATPASVVLFYFVGRWKVMRRHG